MKNPFFNIRSRSSFYSSRISTVKFNNERSISSSTSSWQQQDSNQPLPFSKSGAATWNAKSAYGGRNAPDDTPWYQSLSISLSISAILIWFCILREENDVDKELGKSLYDRVDGLEKKQLELALQQGGSYSKKEITAFQKRLDELNRN